MAETIELAGWMTVLVGLLGLVACATWATARLCRGLYDLAEVIGAARERQRITGIAERMSDDQTCRAILLAVTKDNAEVAIRDLRRRERSYVESSRRVSSSGSDVPAIWRSRGPDAHH